MATYTRTTTVRTRHAWHVPGATYGSHGAAIEELFKAVSAARVAYTDMHGAEPFYDDWLRVYAEDDRITLFFDVDAPAQPVTPVPKEGWIVTNVHGTCYGCDIGFAAGTSMFVTNTDDNFDQVCTDCYRAREGNGHRV